MGKRRKALTDAQKATLDAAFKARFEQDVSELERQVDALRRQGKTTTVATKIEALAKLVAGKIGLTPRGVQQRLYGNGIPKSFAEREKLMQAIEDVLKEEYEKVGAPFVQEYQLFVNPLDGEDYGDDDDDAGVSVPYGSFDQWIHWRVGSFLADSDEPAHVDTIHHYEEIFRQDMLDYATGDFYSIRRLKGRNVTARASHFVLYRESSERTFTFNDAQVKALDVPTRERLSVEPELGFEKLSHTHAFRIHLRKPIEPGEAFDIVYNIRLPGELEDLKRDSEVMSISLTRIANGVDKLTFNVALSRKPQATVAYKLTQARKVALCDGTPPSVTPYKPKFWFENPEQLGIEWSVEKPYIIRWNTTKPQGRMYIINFRGEDPDSPIASAAR